MKKDLLALVFLILSSLGLLGQTWTGNIDSSWDKAGNWSTNSVPGPASSVTIPGGLVNHPVLTAATTLNSLSFSPGSQLDFNGHSLTLNNLINLQGGTLTNSGNGPINIVVNGGTSTLRESEIQGDLVIQINGNAAFQEANTGGPNVFNGNVTYKMASTGTFTISNNFRSLYKGSLIVERTVAGATNIFTAGTTPSIIVEGDFSYINPVGGATTIGHTSEKSIILGNVNIDYNSAENYPTFILRCIDNFQGESEGVISIENPGSLQILRDTLKLKEFRVVGKRGASTADFDYNDFAVTDGWVLV